MSWASLLEETIMNLHNLMDTTEDAQKIEIKTSS
jgi:hypothetical protein